MDSRWILPAMAAGLLGWPAEGPSQGFTPADAARKMTAAAGLNVRLVASEPMIRQPVAIDFDDRGRLWAVQYLQYPNPEGARRVEVDRYSRTKYDRLPDPPPKGVKGADRITILEDTDGDGVVDRAKDFVTGLNLASGLAFDNNGVYVLNPPYLLYYADRNRDDIPDGDPDVLLSGFGIEDAHSVANSLTWGPDGWLYGLQGSTVTAHINDIEFQQGVWRYHPRTKRFELFAEGGGNMWGLDFDDQGQMFASTNVGGNVTLHVVRDAYYWKLFTKHGPLHDPHAYGYFDHVPHEGVKGGHVAVGGSFYLADAFPEEFRGAYLAADLLDHSAHWHRLERAGSSFRAKQMGDLLVANDTWFAPSDLTVGPDGSVYIADWHDRRTAHPDPDADWDRTNGRVFAIDGPARHRWPGVDLRDLDSAELLKKLDDPNAWARRRARRILAERREPATLEAAKVIATTGPRPLEGFWLVSASGGLDAGFVGEMLAHPDEHVRSWAVRTSTDDPVLSNAVAPRLVDLARDEPSPLVLSELSGAAKRMPEGASIDLIRMLMNRHLDPADPYIPLRLWWSIGPIAVSRAESLGDSLATTKDEMTRRTIRPRLIRRWLSEGQAPLDDRVADLVAGDSANERDDDAASIIQGLKDRKPAAGAVSDALSRRLETWLADRPDSMPLLEAAARAGSKRAIEQANRMAASRDSDRRIAAIGLLSGLPEAPPTGPMLEMAVSAGDVAVELAALDALARSGDATVADRLLEAYASKPPSWQARARGLLMGHRAWAGAFLDAVQSGRIDRQAVPIAEVGRIGLLGDAVLTDRARSLWGKAAPATPEAKLAEVRRLNNDLRADTGDRSVGKELFLKHCSSCHRLFGAGENVGPELTHANRHDRDFLLVSLVDPSGIVRKEYQSVVLQTTSGRVIDGLIVSQTPESITLAGRDGQKTTVSREEVDDLRESDVSLMPDDLYRTLAPQQLRDLFAYLQSEP